MIRYVLFDVDNTLMDFNACARAAIEDAFRQRGMHYTDVVFSTFDRINESLWKKIERGELTKEEHAKIRWQLIFDDLRMEADGPSFEPIFRQCLCFTGVPNMGALELLERIKDKYTLCVASNAPYAQQVSRLKNSGMLPYFKHLFISERMGHMKPSVRFFEACFAELQNPSRDEVLLIGDSLTADIAGGEAFGIQTCWYNPQDLPCPAGSHPTYIIRSFADLDKIL